MKENTGTLCVECGATLCDQACEKCEIVWGGQKLPPELEAFLSYAHNATLEPEKLIELESLLSTLPRIAISASKSQQARRQGLTFKEPATVKLRRLKSLLKYNRLTVPQSAITDQSLPKATQTIKRAYGLANSNITPKKA